MKRAIVVGATSGIGKSLANLLVENGFQVGITGRRKQLLAEIKAENPDNYFTKAFDYFGLYRLKKQPLKFLKPSSRKKILLT